MVASEAIGGIFFTIDEMIWVKKLSICTASNFIYNSWIKIQKTTRRMCLLANLDNISSMPKGNKKNFIKAT